MYSWHICSHSDICSWHIISPSDFFRLRNVFTSRHRVRVRLPCSLHICETHPHCMSKYDEAEWHMILLWHIFSLSDTCSWHISSPSDTCSWHIFSPRDTCSYCDVSSLIVTCSWHIFSPSGRCWCDVLFSVTHFLSTAQESSNRTRNATTFLFCVIVRIVIVLMIPPKWLYLHDWYRWLSLPYQHGGWAHKKYSEKVWKKVCGGHLDRRCVTNICHEHVSLCETICM